MCIPWSGVSLHSSPDVSSRFLFDDSRMRGHAVCNVTQRKTLYCTVGDRPVTVQYSHVTLRVHVCYRFVIEQIYNKCLLTDLL